MRGVPGELNGDGWWVLASMSVLAGIVGAFTSPLLSGGLAGVLGESDRGGVGNASLSSRDEVGGMWAMMDRRLGGWYMGVDFLRNFLFLSVNLRPVNSDEVLVKLTYFNDCSSVVPFIWVGASWVLNPNLITYF